MATRTVETGMADTRRVRAICAMAACILLGLGMWRGAGILTKPAEAPVAASVEQQNLISVIETLAGPGNARVTVRRSGKGIRDFLVLIDTSNGTARPLGKQIEAMLVSAAGFDPALGDTLTVREYAFVGGSASKPATSELVELGVIGLLVFLLSWGAFAPARQTVETQLRPKTKRSSDEQSARPRPVAVDLNSSTGNSAASAARTANEDPAGTAKIIRAWMHAPEAKS